MPACQKEQKVLTLLHFEAQFFSIMWFNFSIKASIEGLKLKIAAFQIIIFFFSSESRQVEDAKNADKNYRSRSSNSWFFKTIFLTFCIKGSTQLLEKSYAMKEIQFCSFRRNTDNAKTPNNSNTTRSPISYFSITVEVTFSIKFSIIDFLIEERFSENYYQFSCSVKALRLENAKMSSQYRLNSTLQIKFT